jgi:hypothetical protein
MSVYFCATVEGEAPDDMSEAEVAAELDDALPGWCDAYLTRHDGSRRRHENGTVEWDDEGDA